MEQEKDHEYIGSSESTDEMFGDESEDYIGEGMAREEIKEWLSKYGDKMFAIEAAKYLNKRAIGEVRKELSYSRQNVRRRGK